MGVTVGVAVSVGGIGVAVFVGVAVAIRIVAVGADIASVGLGPNHVQAASAQPKTMLITNFFILDNP